MSARTIRSIGEEGVIARFKKRVRRTFDVQVGIGDDAALLRSPRGKQLVMASDMLVDGVHFRSRRTRAQDIGWKALACNISDIAAMGARPRWATFSLGMPPSTPVSFFDALASGLLRCAGQFGVTLVGGDTVRSRHIVIDVAILGTLERARAILRSGARIGDALFVTGRLGGALSGGRHARFVPRLREAQVLTHRLPLHAMIDISDGLASDLWQIARESRVTLRIESACVPISRKAGTLNHALMDGEDFELLFTLSSREATKVPKRIGRCPVTRIGAVSRRGAGVEFVGRGGRVRKLEPKGFRHF